MKKKIHLILIILLAALMSPSYAQIEQQQQQNWCWVACVQSVVYQAGNYIPQPNIAAALTGLPQNRPASIGEVVALCRYFGLRAWAAGRPGSSNELYSSLLSGWKLIAFVRPTNGPVGHFILLQGVAPSGEIVMSDPAFGTTQTLDLNTLYFSWRWSDSVIVGR